MKILTIIGSPRKKGNSYQAAKKLEAEMKSKGDYDFEYLFLKDTHLEICKGCFNCISKGGDLCPLKDDRDMIEEKMQEADGLVMVSPVYVMQVTSLMKNFIDRLAYRCHRPLYHGKKAIVLSTTGGMGLDKTLKYMKDITEVWGYDVEDECGLTTPPFPYSEKLKKKNQDKILKAASKFDKSLKSSVTMKVGESSVGFNRYLTFRIFQTISEDVKEYMPADYQFYKNKEYYHPGRIGIFTKIATGIMLKVMFFMMRDLDPVKE
jgi:multimeric flavodoxin WrbA